MILALGPNYVNQEVFRTKLLLKDFYNDFKYFLTSLGTLDTGGTSKNLFIFWMCSNYLSKNIAYTSITTLLTNVVRFIVLKQLQ
jgi:hypothetical protein